MFLRFLKLSPTDGGEGDGGAGAGGQAAGSDGGQGGAGGTPAPWFDSFDDIKSDPALVEVAGKYKSPAEALKSINAGWGEDWRQKFAGDDAAKLERLQRYATPQAALDAGLSAQDKIRSGEHKKPLPANANEQEIQAYRETHGIPLTPEAYLEKLPDGLVIGEVDKPIFESFAKALHAKNAPPEIAHAAVQWYNEFVEEQQAEVAENDATHKAESEDTLRAQWGGDYRANVNVIESFLGTMPAEVADHFRSARAPDGRLLFHVPEVMATLAQNARELNGVVTIAGIEGAVPAEKLDDAIAEAERFMRTNRADYNKDPKRQARLLGLYEARIKRDSKGRAA